MIYESRESPTRHAAAVPFPARKLLLFLACTLASGQALRDVVAGTDLPFKASGNPVNSCTVEFRPKASTSLVYVFVSPDIACRVTTGTLQCYSNVESNPVALPVVDGTDYRVRFVHDYDRQTNYCICGRATASTPGRHKAGCRAILCRWPACGALSRATNLVSFVAISVSRGVQQAVR